MVRIISKRPSSRTVTGSMSSRGWISRSAKGNRWPLWGCPGAGKSTLIHILGTLDHPTSGADPLRRRRCVSPGRRRDLPHSGTGKSALSSSFTTSFPSSQPWKMR
ncbi:MAG: hypothetical protein MZV70_48645 [Desulfobacterales bacterium]|nr:hypothetical protein [Desulfobacterales bacterium]